MKRFIISLVLSTIFLSMSYTCAVVISNDFSSDPVLDGGWSYEGPSSLYSYNSTAQNVDFVWNANTNYGRFYKTLGSSFNENANYYVSMDFTIASMTGEGAPIRFGFYNSEGTSNCARQMIEFVWWANSSWGEYCGYNTYDQNGWYGEPVGWEPMGTGCHSRIVSSATGVNYTAELTVDNGFIWANLLTNGVLYQAFKTNTIDSANHSFNLDIVGIYSQKGEWGEDNIFPGSIDNFYATATIPEPFSLSLLLMGLALIGIKMKGKIWG